MEEIKSLLDFIAEIPKMMGKCGVSPKELDIIQDIRIAIIEWNKYKDLEEQGLLPKCKPGDTVYEIHQLTGKITERKIRKITICNAQNLTIMYESGFHYLIVNEDFGKTVFLTRPEAEDTLAEMEVNE